MWRLRRLPNTSFVHQPAGKQECYDYANGRALPVAEIAYIQRERGFWYLVDSVPPQLEVPRTLLVTSPKYEVWKQFSRQPLSRRIFMPVWSWAEIAACRQICFPSTEEKQVTEAYQRWGGICRYVLVLLRPADQELLETAIRGANLDVLVQFANDREVFSQDLPHSLLHFIVDEDAFLVKRMAFASVYVAEQVYCLFEEKKRSELRQLISSSGDTKLALGSFRGIIFEEMAHHALQHGGDFFIRSLEDGDRTAAKQPYVVERGLKLMALKSAADLRQATAATYARPTSRTFPSLDSVLLPFDHLAPTILFQMTLSNEHDIKLHGLNQSLDSLPPSCAGREVWLVFVTLPDVATAFKRQRYVTTKEEEARKTPSRAVKQFVLEIPLVAHS